MALFFHRRYLKGKKGIIKLQALYWMENIVLFTCHDKEIRALVLRVLESRVEHLDQHYATIKDYNHSPVQTLRGNKSICSKSNIGAGGAISTSFNDTESENRTL
jgi:hypothetical protein